MNECESSLTNTFSVLPTIIPVIQSMLLFTALDDLEGRVLCHISCCSTIKNSRGYRNWPPTYKRGHFLFDIKLHLKKKSRTQQPCIIGSVRIFLLR